MRHKKGFNHLGRTSEHRKAMLSNMATSLILHKRIATTTAKAKELRTYVEPLITKSREDNTHSRRVVFSYLKNKHAVSELFREVSPKVADRPGGYTRILKTGNRLGDNADMCIIELVDYNENMLSETGIKSKATRRRRGGKKKGETEAVAAVAPAKSKKKDASKEEEVTAETVDSSVEIAEAEITDTEVAETEVVDTDIDITEAEVVDTEITDTKVDEAAGETTSSDEATDSVKENSTEEEDKKE